MLIYFMVIWSILRPFGLFCGHLVYFLPFWYVVQRKIWQPRTRRESRPLFRLQQNCCLRFHGKLTFVQTFVSSALKTCSSPRVFFPCASIQIQGCQMVYLYTINVSLIVYLKVLGWKMVYFWQFGIFWGALRYIVCPVVNFVSILVHFSPFVFCTKKSGKPYLNCRRQKVPISSDRNWAQLALLSPFGCVVIHPQNPL
jgi:hypothetical protein